LDHGTVVDIEQVPDGILVRPSSTLTLISTSRRWRSSGQAGRHGSRWGSSATGGRGDTTSSACWPPGEALRPEGHGHRRWPGGPSGLGVGTLYDADRSAPTASLGPGCCGTGRWRWRSPGYGTSGEHQAISPSAPRPEELVLQTVAPLARLRQTPPRGHRSNPRPAALQTKRLARERASEAPGRHCQVRFDAQWLLLSWEGPTTATPFGLAGREHGQVGTSPTNASAFVGAVVEDHRPGDESTTRREAGRVVEAYGGLQEQPPSRPCRPGDGSRCRPREDLQLVQ